MISNAHLHFSYDYTPNIIPKMLLETFKVSSQSLQNARNSQQRSRITKQPSRGENTTGLKSNIAAAGDRVEILQLTVTYIKDSAKGYLNAQPGSKNTDRAHIVQEGHQMSLLSVN